jgi:hypothetical protein
MVVVMSVMSVMVVMVVMVLVVVVLVVVVETGSAILTLRARYRTRVPRSCP